MDPMSVVLQPASQPQLRRQYQKNLPSGTGKDILSPLVGTSWDVLVVGGVFAVIVVFPYCNCWSRSPSSTLLTVSP
ncbi:MAG: hypothetical protein R2864_01105 [Syntrophotaleaceae bacterium]